MKFMKVRHTEYTPYHQIINIKNPWTAGQLHAWKFCKNLTLLRWNRTEPSYIHVTIITAHWKLLHYKFHCIYFFLLRLFEILEYLMTVQDYLEFLQYFWISFTCTHD